MVICFCEREICQICLSTIPAVPETGTNRENIIIRADAFTDLNDDWYLAVANNETNPVTFTIRAVVSTNFLDVTNVVHTNEFVYYLAEVPATATYATNVLTSLTGGSLNMWFNQDFPPTGTLPGDYALLNSVTDDTNLLSSVGSSPAVVPGSVYVVGVQNTNAIETNDFRLQIDFGFADPSLVIISLTNAIAFSNNITAGSALQYYSFDISTNAAAASFETFNADGNVHLYLRKDLPLPQPSDYDYRSINSSTNDELIIVSLSSAPVPITPGTWYLAVENAEGKSVNYSILATEQVANIIDLYNESDNLSW